MTGDQKAAPLRIAVVAACPYPARRGTPIRIEQVSEELARRGHEVHIVTYHFGMPGASERTMVHRIPSIPGYRKMGPGPSWCKLFLLDPFLTAKLLRLLLRRKIDIVHAHHYEGALAAAVACRLTGHPFVYDAHTLLESELPTYGLGLPAKLKRVIGRIGDGRLPGLADHVIAVSDSIRKRLVRRRSVRPDRITTVGNGVEGEWVGEEESGSGDEPDRTRLITFTGNLARYQRIDLLLKAFRRVAEKREDVRLRIVTESDFSPYVKLAEAEGIRDRIDVIRAGPEETRRHLAEADVLVNPRDRCDGVPQKLLNYMATGRPIVSFAGASGPLEKDRTGIIVENGDTDRFGDEILRLLERPEHAREMGGRARETVRQKMSWDKTAATIEKLFRMVIERKRNGDRQDERESFLPALWRFRGLLRNMVVRNIRVKYQSSLLGFAWTLLNPLLILTILLVVFTRVVRIPIENYWAFLVSGFFVWNNVNQILNYGTLVIEEHGPLVRNYSFPGEIPVIAGVTSRTVEFALELVIVSVLLAIFHQHGVTLSLVMIPLLIVVQMMLILGLTLLVATLSVFYEDVRHLLPIGLTALFYVSPVFYSIDLVPEEVRRVFLLNPFAQLLVSYQTVLYEGAIPSPGDLSVLALSATAWLVVGLVVFRRYRGLFAEII